MKLFYIKFKAYIIGFFSLLFIGLLAILKWYKTANEDKKIKIEKMKEEIKTQKEVKKEEIKTTKFNTENQSKKDLLNEKINTKIDKPNSNHKFTSRV